MQGEAGDVGEQRREVVEPGAEVAGAAQRLGAQGGVQHLLHLGRAGHAAALVGPARSAARSFPGDRKTDTNDFYRVGMTPRRPSFCGQMSPTCYVISARFLPDKVELGRRARNLPQL